ncbi:uncharacterized protein LOC119337761 [Triticum dicoccoides]|uniref:uncharacterized protein LOC119337761 n=1 Tax=Triticum dicoccoides TaxID=85692 RepID=UPI0018916434|nr:uncharacterized protein LOC119337761 [Triticum dicoccoides]
MGCISSKVLSRSGSLREKANQGLQRSSLVEEIILSNSKRNGDQFLALLRTSSSAARSSKVDAVEQSPEPASAAAKIETINVSDLLAGLEEENTAEGAEERDDDRKSDGGKTSSLRYAYDVTAGRAVSFRTLEEFDALVSRCGSPEKAEPAPAPAPEPDASVEVEPQAQSSCTEQDAMATASSAPELGETPGGAKRRARARQLGELSAAPGFDFSKSGSLRDWLLGGGQMFSPGSYVTPKFGSVPAAPPESAEHGERAVFDPELVAQLEEAMEELSVDEERVLREVLEVIEAGETQRLERDAPEVLAVIVQD